MARKKLSEFTSKTMLFKTIGEAYDGISIKSSSASGLNKLDPKKSYVVKVDQGVKGRMKKGLVGLKLAPKEIPQKINEFQDKGYSSFLIEEFFQHDGSLERYLSLERTREGNVIYFANVGGIDIEQNQDKVKKEIISEKNIKDISEFLNLPQNLLEKIVQFFDNQYVSFLEINPLVVEKNKVHILDLAIEVDNAAEFFIKNGWSAKDFVESGGDAKTEEEKNIADLQANSQASLKMEVLNPDGSIFVMLFGGGGSIVVADEIYNQGKAQELANYSDYSGGPKEEETVIYVKNILQLLLKSKAKKKVFIIAGTYANFTDVSVTFKGVIKALDMLLPELEKQDIKIFVRRPGPNMQKGLGLIKEYLEKTKMYGGVWDQNMILSDVVLKALDYLKHD